MSDSKSVKMHYDVAGDDFDRAGEASAGLKRLLQKIGVPADIIRRIAIGTYEAEMNVIIHAGGGRHVRPKQFLLYERLRLLYTKRTNFESTGGKGA